jgi:rhodanese-related sulfurtransferase
VAQKLEKAGFAQVFVLKGGWDAWEQANYPIEPK